MAWSGRIGKQDEKEANNKVKESVYRDSKPRERMGCGCRHAEGAINQAEETP